MAAEDQARCPIDGRFVRDVIAIVRGVGGHECIAEVHATCSRCGIVEATREHGWSWEDFYGWNA